MNEHPRNLSTVELISQQALEINRLNYTNSRLSDKLAETWHPEFGSMWRYIESITDLIKLLTDIDKVYKIRCKHSDMDHDPNCLCCETVRIITDAKNCVKGVTCTRVERIHNAVT